jgi:hypothetical protein
MNCAVPVARPVRRELRRRVHGEHVVAVHRDGGDPVAFRLLGEVLHRELLLRGR